VTSAGGVELSSAACGARGYRFVSDAGNAGICSFVRRNIDMVCEYEICLARPLMQFRHLHAVRTIGRF
jgi:hypothetical protein